MGPTTSCFWCSSDPVDQPTYNRREHVFPRSLGGTETFKNKEVCDQHNAGTSALEQELSKEGIEALARVGFGPDGRSVKQARKRARDHQLIGPATRRLEGKSRQVSVQNGIAFDGVSFFCDTGVVKGLAFHIFPALVVARPEGERVAIECGGSDGNELNDLIERLAGDEAIYIDVVDQKELPKETGYQPRVRLDSDSRLVASAVSEEEANKVADWFRKMAREGKITTKESWEAVVGEPRVNVHQKIDYSKKLRGAGKIMLNMVAFRLGPQVAAATELEELRRYVLHGTSIEGPVQLAPGVKGDESAGVGHTIRLIATSGRLNIVLVLYARGGFQVDTCLPLITDDIDEAWIVTVDGDRKGPSKV